MSSKTFHRAASVRAQTFDEKEKTVEVIWTTGAAVARCDWRTGDEYVEVLSLEQGAVRLDRLNAGAPLLNTHSSWTLEDVIGSVVRGSARVEGGKGVAIVKLSGAAADANTVQKICEGVIRNISVGYLIHAYSETEVDGVTTRTATDWEPLEISAVPIPADAGAQFRSHGRRRPAKAPVPRTAVKRKVPTRIADIRRWARKADLRALGEEHVRLGTSSDDFFRLITDRLMGRRAPTLEDLTMSNDKRDYEAGRRWAERTLGRKSSRDEDEPKKDDDLDEDERDDDEVCATCGKALDSHDDDRDDDVDDDRDEDVQDKDQDERGRAYLQSSRRGGESVRSAASGSHRATPASRAAAKTTQPWSEKITDEGLEAGRRHWERATGRKATA